MRSIRVRAPAKVNLGLRVLGRRADGYHLLESLFVPLDLADELEVSARETGAGEVAGEVGGGAKPLVLLTVDRAADAGELAMSQIPLDSGNLAYRAAESFARRAGLALEIRIRLIKRIPAAAGLGGGSSDAGAVLRALDNLFPGAVPADALANLALSLGADVPFFLDPRPALVSGVGERIEPVEGLSPLWLVLANPGESIATSKVYDAYDELSGALTSTEPGSTMRSISRLRTAVENARDVDAAGEGRGDGAGDGAKGARRAARAEEDAKSLVCSIESLLENDLETAASRLCPQIGSLERLLLEAGALAAGMSGSGATVFGVFAREEVAVAALEQAAFGESVWRRVAVSEGSR